MAIEYTWSIPTTEYSNEDGGIFCIHWRATGVDGDYTASSYGTVSLTPDASSPDFVAYADVTEAMAQAWVWDSVSQDAIEAAIADKIDAMANSTSETGLPWENTERRSKWLKTKMSLRLTTSTTQKTN